MAVATFTALLSSGITAHAQTAQRLRIGVQYGLGYLPVYIAAEAKLFEVAMRKQGLDALPVEVVHFTGSPQMNDGLLSDNLEMGTGGYTAMMIFCDRTRSNGDGQFLGATALANVPYELFTTNAKLKELKDLDPAVDKVGLPAVKVSQPAVYMQMAAEQMFGAGKQGKFDDLTVSLAQPDGVASLLSGGGAVNGYLLSPPFNTQLLGKPGIRKVWSSNELFGAPATALASWTTAKIHKDNPKLFAAYVDAIRQAMTLISSDKKRAAEIYLSAEKSKLSADFIAGVFASPDLRYTLAPEQTVKIAEFMFRTGVLKNKPASWKDYFFPEVHGEAGN